jgi:starch-binding outer membrane protein, SusD/RagB family
MNSKIVLIGSFIILTYLTSCINYLDPYPNGDRSFDDLWEYQGMVQGLVGQSYDYMPRQYNDNEGVYFDGATDDAVLTSSTNDMRRLALGTLPTSRDPFVTFWDRDYKAIKLVNTFLKDRMGYKTRFLIDKHFNDLVKNRLQGEAFALRAWFYWDLLQKFGGMGTDGNLLGIPIILEPIDPDAGANYARNSYDDCVRQIIKDCDSAYKYLPIAHRDFLVPVTADRAYAGGRYWGRWDGISTRALKAIVFLTWASPRFNPAGDVSRWDSAASNAKKVMDFKLTKDAVTNGFNATNSVNWLNPNFPGIVISARYTNSSDVMERMFYPAGFQGNGEIGPSQELINAFGTSNGYPINDPSNRGGYQASNPYNNRDPRFYSMFFYNTAIAKRSLSPFETMYTFETFQGGKDQAGSSPSNSLTNYYVKKYVFMGLNWADNSINRQPHSKFFIRWDNMCLIFAEAANHVTHNPNTALYGLTPKAALKYLRSRKTYDGLTPTFSVNDPYLDEVAGLGEVKFDELVKNERRIETCFEGTRFYDLRRWTTTLDALNTMVHGAKIQKNLDGTFTYNLQNEVERRIYNSAYLPIPYNEILRMGKLIQNEGWDNWN